MVPEWTACSSDRSARALEQAGDDTVVRMACLDDGANGRVLSSYLHTLQWDCVTSSDPGLLIRRHCAHHHPPAATIAKNRAP